MPEIVVLDLSHVTVDGEVAGSIFDVAWNRPQLDGIQGLILAALQSWLDARDKAHADAVDALRGGMADAHAGACVDLQAKYDAEIAARDAALVDAVNAERARGKSALEELQAKHDAEIAKCKESAATLEARIKELEADVAEKQNLVNALGGTELGRRLRAEAKKQELLEARGRLESQLKELGVEADA